LTDTASYAAHGATKIPFGADCPSRLILDQIADKWSMMTLAVLERPTRFNEIKRRLDGVTQRVLTQTLRRLQRNGMITRRVIATSPIGVEYALTPLGESLRAPFGHLYDWTVEHAATIQAAQLNYDAGAPAPT
jgi:DNA-binding HxlR family transcriptional regulator